MSLKLNDYYNAVEAARRVIEEAPNLTSEEKDQVVTVGYGHIGDGDLHINVSLPGYENEDLMKRLNNLVYPFVMNFVR